MKKYNYKFILILLLSALIFSCSDDDSSTGPEGEITNDPALVGTWDLTKIISPFETTPESVGIALSATFSADGKMQLTTISDSTTVESGTWSTSNGALTITLEGEDPVSSPYSINGIKTTIANFPVNYLEQLILATLEFTKRM